MAAPAGAEVQMEVHMVEVAVADTNNSVSSKVNLTSEGDAINSIFARIPNISSDEGVDHHWFDGNPVVTHEALNLLH
jgi:hypothetical protein